MSAFAFFDITVCLKIFGVVVSEIIPAMSFVNPLLALTFDPFLESFASNRKCQIQKEIIQVLLLQKVRCCPSQFP